MNIFKFSQRNFSMKNRPLIKEFNLTKKEIKQINNLIKNPWIKPGWDKTVGTWFLVSAGITLGMIIIGGYVRLNKAGLSMVKWDLQRLIAPKTNEEWKKEFEEYKKHPQYKNDFPNLTIEGFKNIYLLEHYHRQLGKVLGIFFIVPSILFSVSGILNKNLKIRCAVISSVIIIQGVIGYWMVKSGLKENLGENYKKNNVTVSPYRLTIHFTFGIVTYWLLLNSALFLLSKPQVLRTNFLFLNSNNIIRRNLIVTLHLVLFTAIFGSLMAGQDAGKICNTFPKMGGIWYPTKHHYDENLNWIKNNLENKFLIHFNHRLLATVTLLTIFFQTYRLLGLGFIPKGAIRGFAFVAGCACLQFYLGILSVIQSVPPSMAHFHQFIGVMTFTACIFAINSSRKVRPNEIRILFKKLYEKDSNQLEKYLHYFKDLHSETYTRFLKKEHEACKENNN